MSPFWMNILGLVVSVLFVVGILGTSTVLSQKQKLSNESSRKFIHIAVANWWIIAMIFFNNAWYAAIVPAIFIVLNYASYRLDLVKAMERKEDKTLGTVYFPISLLILVFLSFGAWNRPEIGAMGILIMGYGDGLAAVFGQRYGKKKIYKKKSWIGSIAMFTASLIVAVILFALYASTVPFWFFYALLLALIATLLELFIGDGMDNLAVPVVTSLVFYLILMM